MWVNAPRAVPLARSKSAASCVMSDDVTFATQGGGVRRDHRGADVRLIWYGTPKPGGGVGSGPSHSSQGATTTITRAISEKAAHR
jgi:hypothetical protein